MGWSIPISAAAEAIVLLCRYEPRGDQVQLGFRVAIPRRAGLARESCRLSLPTVAASEASGWRRLAERVGVFGADLRKPNEDRGFVRKPENRNDLAFSISCQELRLFAGNCRFFYFDDTRHDTRRGGLPECLSGNLAAKMLGDYSSSSSSARTHTILPSRSMTTGLPRSL